MEDTEGRKGTSKGDSEEGKKKMQQFCLKWKYHSANIQSTFSTLREKASYCDVTLWCGGAAMRAHRAVLAACSGLFRDLLAEHDSSLGEPSIVLTDNVHAQYLRHILTFMYSGEVRILQTELPGFLKVAEELQIKGLGDATLDNSNIKSDKVTVDTNGTKIDISSAPSSPTDSQTASKSDDEEGKANKSPSVSFVSSYSINGASLLVPVVTNEPLRRKRGRPPLEPKTGNMENEIAPLDPPKRPKLFSMPNILRKSKLEPKNDSNISWTFSTDNKHENNDNDALSDYSETSLDGQDISQFLDTQMEEGDPANDVSFHLSKNSNENDLSNHTAKEYPNFADVVRLPDYLVSGRRTQFWTEDYVKRVMEAIFCRELEMKQAAEILGVSYGTLYGRYRDTFGCINRPYRTREFWAENSDILAKLQKKEISFLKAAELLNITPQMLFTYVNTIGEPIINQKEASDIFSETLMRASAKSDDENTVKADDFDFQNPESCNSLSDILRKYVDEGNDLTTIKTNIPVQEGDTSPIVIDADPLEIEPDPELVTESEPTLAVETAAPLAPVEVSPAPSSSSSSSVTITQNKSVKKLPVIRVTDLKRLKGELPSSIQLAKLGEKGGHPIIFKATATSINQPDLKMISLQRKMTTSELLSMKSAAKKITTATVVKQPQAPIT